MDASDKARGPSRPRKVKELVEQAEAFSFNVNIPLKHWLRAAETTYQEALFALSEGDYGRAFVMLYRHSILVSVHIPKHPEFREPENRHAYKPLAKRLKLAIQDLEALKPRIQEAYQEWERMQPLPAVNANLSSRTNTFAEYEAKDPSLSGNVKVLDASENQEFAVDLAQKELNRRDTLRQTSKLAGISEQETRLRRGGGLWDQSSSGPLSDDLQTRLETTRRNLDATQHRHYAEDHGVARYSSNNNPPRPASYHYPSIHKLRSPDNATYMGWLPESDARTRPPTIPPKFDLPSWQSFEQEQALPLIPQKIPLRGEDSSMYPHSNAKEDKPIIPKKINPEAPAVPQKDRLTFRPGAYLENGDPVRSVFLPSKLRETFLEIAADKTRAGLEMCAIICGTPVNNALFVRCLLIPDQKSTPDTCETENESAMFDYCDSEDLLVLGWIHTHPTQTCFMSSRDLHTHAGYQIMMPESVAIVCAPRFKPSYGVFRLTHPPGLDHILECTHSDTFHQHSVTNLYRDAGRPHGHVYESDKLPFYVKDLRTQ